MSDEICDKVIVTKHEDYVELVTFCDTYKKNGKKPNYPCVVTVTHHYGMGHGEDWYTHSVIAPSADKNYTPEETMIFLEGAMAVK